MKHLVKIFIIALLLVSCRAKQVIHTIETHDTIKDSKVLRITEPKLNQLVIDEPCDSLGNLKPTHYEIRSPKSHLTVKSVKNALIITEKQDSIVEEHEVKEKVSTTAEHEVKIKIKTPKWAWYSLIINILLLVWTFRRFIKFLPF